MIDESDSEEETLEDMLKIPVRDVDHTVYDDYTWMYCSARKGRVKETEKSLEARAVYQKRHFIMVIVCNFYCSACSIPCPLIMRGDGVGGFVVQGKEVEARFYGSSFGYSMYRSE